MPTSWQTSPSRPRRATATSNGDIVRRVYELTLEGRLDDAGALLHEEIEWREPPEVPDRQPVRGRAAAIAAVGSWMATWDAYDFELLDLREVDDEHVLGVVRQRATGAESGAAVESVLFMLWTLADGAPICMEMYLTPERACEAAGLRDLAL